MLTAYRKEPDIGRPAPWIQPQSYRYERLGCGWSLLFTVIAYFVLSAICRVISNTGSDLDKVISYGALICFVIMLLAGMRDWWKECDARRAERQAWARSCQTAILTIKNRYQTPGWWDDSSNRWRNGSNQIELEMSPEQQAVCPNETIVSLDLSDYLYDRLKKRDAVRIYYLPESPLTFLLEEEV